MKWMALFVMTLVLFSGAAHPDLGKLEPLVGDYVLKERTKATQQRDASIESVVQRLSILVRGIARKRLREGNAIPSRLSIQQDGSKMTIGFDGSPWTGAVGGRAVPTVSERGDPLKMTLIQKGTTLTQRFVGEDGGRENVFRAHDDRLTVDVRVFSDRLPADVVYRLEFAR